MSTQELALPTTGDSSEWNEREKALVEAAGLVKKNKDGSKQLADRPTVEAFLQHCIRTGLDPIARQIYAVERAGKWTIQVSIDGARLVAERTGQYRGQTPVQWTSDGVTWSEVWLSSDPPKAARVGVYREGFHEPLVAVATWDSYVVTKDEWVGGKRTGNKTVSDMWQKFGPLMLGKCAEMLALRKAFPQDLSGIYSSDEMGQAAAPADGSIQAVASVEVAALADEDWQRLQKSVETARDKVALRAVYNELKSEGKVSLRLAGTDKTVHDFLMQASAPLPERYEEAEVVELVEDEPLAGFNVNEATGEVEGAPDEDWPTVEIPTGEVSAE